MAKTPEHGGEHTPKRKPGEPFLRIQKLRLDTSSLLTDFGQEGRAQKRNLEYLLSHHSHVPGETRRIPGKPLWVGDDEEGRPVLSWGKDRPLFQIASLKKKQPPRYVVIRQHVDPSTWLLPSETVEGFLAKFDRVPRTGHPVPHPDYPNLSIQRAGRIFLVVDQDGEPLLQVNRLKKR